LFYPNTQHWKTFRQKRPNTGGPGEEENLKKMLQEKFLYVEDSEVLIEGIRYKCSLMVVGSSVLPGALRAVSGRSLRKA
jgi:hypothetical protein